MNHLLMNDLLDCYGTLLTPRQYQIASYYYQEDLSISEIAQELEISRTAVHKTIHTVQKQLEKFEQNIHALSMRRFLEKIQASNHLDENIKVEIQTMLTE